jgi:hypothetical protein
MNYIFGLTGKNKILIVAYGMRLERGGSRRQAETTTTRSSGRSSSKYGPKGCSARGDALRVVRQKNTPGSAELRDHEVGEEARNPRSGSDSLRRIISFQVLRSSEGQGAPVVTSDVGRSGEEGVAAERRCGPVSKGIGCCRRGRPSVACGAGKVSPG